MLQSSILFSVHGVFLTVHIIGEIGAEAIAAAIRKAPRIKHVDYSGNAHESVILDALRETQANVVEQEASDATSSSVTTFQPQRKVSLTSTTSTLPAVVSYHLSLSTIYIYAVIFACSLN